MRFLHKIYITWLFFLTPFIFTPNIQNCSNHTISYLKTNPQLTTELLTVMLQDNGYILIDNLVELQYKPYVIIGIARTDKGKKFLKLHDKTRGIREFKGAYALSEHVQVLLPEAIIYHDNLELLIQPFDSYIASTMLFCTIQNQIVNKLNLGQICNNMFQSMFNVAQKTLIYEQQRASNDFLYYERLKTKAKDDISGRIELFYEKNRFNLSTLTYSWQEILHKKFCIDGIEYQETLAMLLDKADQILNPKNSRLISISHGDWHEMNLCVNPGTKIPLFFDCEHSGYNDVIGDAVVFLMYTAIMFDYITPKYYPEQFAGLICPTISQDQFKNKHKFIQAHEENNMIELQGVHSFGTSDLRKKIIQECISIYLQPLILYAQQKFHITDQEIEDRFRACILLRLLGLYNITTMDPMDQTKIIALLFKIIGTTKNTTNSQTTLNRLQKAL